MSTTVAPEGRKLLRVEARNAQTPIESKPDWLHYEIGRASCRERV